MRINDKNTDFTPSINNTKVEQNHITAAKQIKLFREAGIRLAEYRKEQYDFENEQEAEANPTFHDPTRNPGFDLADATETLRSVANKMQSAMAFEKHKKKIQATAKPEPEPKKD